MVYKNQKANIRNNHLRNNTPKKYKHISQSYVFKIGRSGNLLLFAKSFYKNCRRARLPEWGQKDIPIHPVDP